MQGGIFHPGPDDGLCFYWHSGGELTMKHWSSSHPSLFFPPPSSLIFYTPSIPPLACTHTASVDRWVSFAVSDTVSHPPCHAEIEALWSQSSVWAVSAIFTSAAGLRRRHIRCHLLLLQLHQIVTAIIRNFKETILCVMRRDSFGAVLKQCFHQTLVVKSSS